MIDNHEGRALFGNSKRTSVIKLVCSLGLFIIFPREPVLIKVLECPETHFLMQEKYLKTFEDINKNNFQNNRKI